MNPFYLNHSLKNIPLPNKSQYKRILVAKVEKFVGNLRWKLFNIQNPSGNEKDTYGFRTTNSPPQLKELTAFEDDLYKLTKNIEFRTVNNKFQDDLKQSIKSIQTSPDIIVKADKSRNLYSLTTDEYTKLLAENVTADYRKGETQHVDLVNKEAKKLASKLDLDDRIDQYVKADAFITVKDHKPNFPSRVKCRLINPAKSNMGQISKCILEKAVNKIVSDTRYNQWKNSTQVISWFKNLPNKSRMSFLKFDIVNFYPSISQALFEKALEWAKSFYLFSAENLEIIQNARKSFLFTNGELWKKKDNPEFDITMGSFDGAECCELVGLYILNQLKDVLTPENVGLYRDDGLAAIPGSGPEVEAKRKKVCKVFQELGLKVTTEVNIRKTDFLDIYFDLENNSFRPFRKDNQMPLYINAQSNHPKNVKKNLPQMISDRISNLSSTAEIYESEKKTYEEALRAVGYSQQLHFNETKQSKKKNRKRQILWFNPPFSDNVMTNIGSKFLSLIDKHFKNSPLGKYFNRKTIKVSYSCLPNISAIISGHNQKLIQGQVAKQKQEDVRECNCKAGKADCPLQGHCLQKGIIYKASLKSAVGNNTYIGQAGNTFKERFTSHKASFKNRKYETSTALSKQIWRIKDSNLAYDLKWEKLASASTYQPKIGKCNLCNLEKTIILFSTDKNVLNKRSELMNKCRHRNKYLLSAIK